MIIMPAATPLAISDVSINNQSQQQHVQLAEESKKATDTVQVSAQARELAGANLNNKPDVNTAPAAIQKAADNEVTERVADNEAVEQQRPTNPVTNKPETTKINILA